MEKKEGAKPPKVKAVKSLDDIELPSSGSVDIPRGDKEVLRVPIRAIALDEQEKMSKDYEAPAPPRHLDVEQSKEAGRSVFYLDDTDPVYLKQIEDINMRQAHATAVTGIDIDIPGSTVEERWDHLCKKLTVGDLSIILGAILEMSNISEELVEEAKKSLIR